MKRIEQTILANDPSGVPGNCLQASVAMLLGLELDMVPHFVLYDDEWGEALFLFCKSKGYALEKVYTIEPSIPHMVFGKSPRGDYRHAVVWYNGGIYDPHPDQTGLDDGEVELWRLVKYE